jgi:ABC-2 type transport system permease protein
LKRIGMIVRREYLDRVRSKAFLIGTILGPVFMAAMMVVPILMAGKVGKAQRIAVLDESGALAGPLEAALARHELDGQPRFVVVPLGAGAAAERARALRDDVLAGRLDGYLHVPADALEARAASYYGRTVSNVIDLGLLERAVDEAFVGRRLAAAGVDPALAGELTRGLELKRVRLSATGEREDRGAAMFLSLILMMILYMSVLIWGQQVLTSTIEEKANRVMEVIVSSVPSVHLMAGKLLGVGAAGLTQLGVWAVCLLGASVMGMGAAGGFRMPEVTPLVLVAFVLFYLLGYLLYASLFMAVGAAVNTSHEAQSLAFPVMAPMILSVMLFMPVLQSPDGRLAVVASLVPFFTPLLMFLRISVLAPPAWQIALSVLLTALTVVAALWGAARIYRVGILMYGKRPTFPELMRWIGRR